LSPELLRAVSDAGYTDPTPIQRQAIPAILTGHDVLGIAQTGTGKTASFTLPMIDILARGRAKARMPRTLILEPTRELAAQVAEAFEKYGKHHKLTKALLIGGESFSDQDRLIDRGVDVLIATPGRLLDHVERGKVMLHDVKVMVIDEADRMLDMGFIPDVERIARLVPPRRQTMLFSATMPPEIRRLSDAFMRDPKSISVDPPTSPAETVEQWLVPVRARDKTTALRHLVDDQDIAQALIFCNRRRDAASVARTLQRAGYNAGALHGDMPQAARNETLMRFRAGEIGLLVCSDVAARGLDIIELPNVVNFDVPINPEDYIHRIGRTGRAGRSGRAFTLLAGDDAKRLRSVERLIGRKIERLDGGDEAAESPPPKDDAKPAAKRGRKANGDARPRRDERRGNRRDEQRDERREDREDREARRGPVVGLGDHVPAFLLRPVDLPPKSADPVVEDDDEEDVEDQADAAAEAQTEAEADSGADPGADTERPKRRKAQRRRAKPQTRKVA
jgi:superfamily II DNA/RNA helicase